MNWTRNNTLYTPTRRQLLTGATAGLMTAGLAGCGSGGGGGSTGSSAKLKITIFAFLGGDLAAMPKAFAKEYSAEHRNVDVSVYENSNTVGYGKMLAQRKADPSQPLVNLGFFNAETTVQGIGDRMWEKLDYGNLSNSDGVTDQFRRKDQFGIGIGADQYGLVTNTSELKSPPDSWEALWDPKYKGQLSLFGFPWYAVYTAAKLNGGGWDDLEPGWKIWEENADQIKLIVESNPQYLNVMSNGTTPLTAYFNGTSYQWITSGAKLKYTVPREGALPVPVYLQSVAGQSEDQQEVCQDIINEMLSPKWSKRWIETSVQVPANEKTKLPADFEKLPAFSQSTIDGFLEVDYEQIGRNTTKWEQRWKSEVLSKM